MMEDKCEGFEPTVIRHTSRYKDFWSCVEIYKIVSLVMIIIEFSSEAKL